MKVSRFKTFSYYCIIFSFVIFSRFFSFNQSGENLYIFPTNFFSFIEDGDGSFEDADGSSENSDRSSKDTNGSAGKFNLFSPSYSLEDNICHNNDSNEDFLYEKFLQNPETDEKKYSFVQIEKKLQLLTLHQLTKNELIWRLYLISSETKFTDIKDKIIFHVPAPYRKRVNTDRIHIYGSRYQSQKLLIKDPENY